MWPQYALNKVLVGSSNGIWNLLFPTVKLGGGLHLTTYRITINHTHSIAQLFRCLGVKIYHVWTSISTCIKTFVFQFSFGAYIVLSTVETEQIWWKLVKCSHKLYGEHKVVQSKDQAVFVSFICFYPGYSEDGGTKKGEVIPEHEFAAGPVCLDDENEFPPVRIQKC